MIEMGFCQRVSDNLMLKMCGKLIEGAPTYAQMFDHISGLGYHVIVHPPFVPVKKWTATVHFVTLSKTIGEYNICEKNETGDNVYLQFDSWIEAADRGILLAMDWMQKHKGTGVKVVNSGTRLFNPEDNPINLETYLKEDCVAPNLSKD